MSNPQFFNGNCLYYPDDKFLNVNEIYQQTVPKSYENLPNQNQKFFINNVEIQPSNDFYQMKNGKYFHANDARIMDATRYQPFEYDFPPLQYNSDKKRDYYRTEEGNQLGSYPDYSSLDTGHNRYYVTNFTMTPYNDTNYTLKTNVQRTLQKYPDGTVRPYYNRVYKDDFLDGYENTSDFLKNSAYFREDFMEIRSRDMNARNYSLNYFY